MYTIRKRFSFSASHRLIGLPFNHPCSRLHGHNYEVEIELAGELNATYFVRDYRDLDMVKQWIDETLDHRHLNDVITCHTTAECIAQMIYDQFKPSIPELSAVSVSETPKTWAEYRP